MSTAQRIPSTMLPRTTPLRQYSNAVAPWVPPPLALLPPVNEPKPAPPDKKKNQYGRHTADSEYIRRRYRQCIEESGFTQNEMDAIHSRSKTVKVCQMRHRLAWLMRRDRTLSLPDIGWVMRMAHNSIQNACRREQARIDAAAEVNANVR